MSLQNGDFRPNLALKWPKSKKIHITEALSVKIRKYIQNYPKKHYFEYHL